MVTATNGYTVELEAGPTSFGWFATWDAARAKQLELAELEVATVIVPSPVEAAVDYGSSPEPQSPTPEWFDARPEAGPVA